LRSLGSSLPQFVVHNFDADRVDPRPLGFDASVRFAPDWRRLGPAVRSILRRRAPRKQPSVYRTNRFLDFKYLVAHERAIRDGHGPKESIAASFASLAPSWGGTW
jgi:hypothetical protein